MGFKVVKYIVRKSQEPKGPKCGKYFSMPKLFKTNLCPVHTFYIPDKEKLIPFTYPFFKNPTGVYSLP